MKNRWIRPKNPKKLSDSFVPCFPFRKRSAYLGFMVRWSVRPWHWISESEIQIDCARFIQEFGRCPRRTHARKFILKTTLDKHYKKSSKLTDTGPSQNTIYFKTLKLKCLTVMCAIKHQYLTQWKSRGEIRAFPPPPPQSIFFFGFLSPSQFFWFPHSFLIIRCRRCLFFTDLARQLYGRELRYIRKGIVYRRHRGLSMRFPILLWAIELPSQLIQRG